jgi:ribonuclease HI
MPWIRRNLRGTKIYVRTNASGQVATGPDGRVDIKYQLDDAAKIYRAAARNLEATSDVGDEVPRGEPEAAPAPPDPRAIVIYTDGACSGNPGPMGIGVVLLDGGKRKELCEYLGKGTSNIAELVAIERGLDALGEPDRARPVLVHSDSTYAIGILAKGFKAKANVELVARLRAKAQRFANLRFVKVAGHAGVPENERCDELARSAVSKGR